MFPALPAALSSDLPAIYAHSTDDASVGDYGFRLGEPFEPEPGSALFFEPLRQRSETLLGALEGSSATAAALRHAAILLDLLPLSVPDPDLIVEDDGQIGFDWRVGDLSLSLNVGVGGMVGYAALSSAESAYGRALFSSTEIPERIAPFLGRLAQQR